MKLTYSNWHKELVHDDAIQSELNNITEGQLEFNNRPFVKHRADNRGDRDDYGNSGNNRNQYRQNNYGNNRNNRNNGGGRNNNSGGRNNNNRNFKKRY